MDNTIGTAYIQIEPSTKGIKGTLSKAMGDEGTSSGESFSNGFSRVLKGAVITGVAVKGFQAGKNFVQGAVDAFGNYEQLVGGVETLFKDSADIVIENASNAYKTAGLSANEYMENVTSFAASLKQSTKTEAEAANIADMAVIDMADNANKMGTSMESIQNAYQGFAKQNYTMLDNLKLGYGGTKKEMQRLLEDATKLTGVEYDIENLSDVYSAIHAIQQELGITGTTSIEAEGTIQGSAASIKAAWQNVLTGMGDSTADLSGLISELVQTAATFASNMMPVISQALTGLVQLIAEIVPVIAEQLPALLPQIIEMVVNLVQGLAEQLPTVIQYLVDAIISSLPVLLQALPGIVVSVVEGLLQSLPILINGVIQLVLLLVEALPDIISAIIEALPTIIALILDALVMCLPQLIAGCIKLVLGIVAAIPQIIVSLLKAIPGIITSIVYELIKGLVEFVNVGEDLIVGLWTGMSNKIDWLKSKIKGFCSSALGAIKDFFGIHSPSRVMADEIGKMLPAGMAVGIDANADSAIDALTGVGDEMTSSLQSTVADVGSSPFNNGIVTANNGANGLYDLLATYLPMIAENGSITLEGDAASMFKVMRNQNNIYKKSTGVSAFA